MRPAFALDLAHDGITLRHRDGDRLTTIGRVALDDPDMDAALKRLRDAAREIAPDGISTELTIPPSQIRFEALPRRERGRITAAALRTEIADITACPPEDLVFDWIVDGDIVRVAVTDRLTLDEAESFADAHGFRPVAFTAAPAGPDFPRAPDFGATSMAADFLPGPDEAPVVFNSARKAPAKPPPPRAETTSTAPPPAAPAPDIRAAAADLAAGLARRTAAETPTRATSPVSPFLRRADAEAADRASTLRLKVAAAVGVAAIVWMAYFTVRGDGPSDPAAALPDTPPAVAVAPPDLAAPATPDFEIAAPPPAPGDTPPTAGPADGETDIATLPPGAEAAPESLARGATEPPAAMADEDPALRYAATGIWQEGPGATAAPGTGDTDTLYLTAIDPVTRSSDAIALPPAAGYAFAPRPVAPAPPPPAGTVVEIGPDGLVVATPEGAITPDGITVALGPPPLTPPPAPARVAETELEPTALAQSLPDLRPRIRPGNLIERNERANLGGLSRNELSGIRPSARPTSAQAAAGADAALTDAAVAASIAPADRPADFATRVATARAVAAALASQPDPGGAPAAAAAPAATARAAPDIPTSASVARQATIENAMRLNRLNLIGVYGTDGDRRALVRLPSGRYVKVEVGDRLDGGRIAAIGRGELRYVKSGRNITLTVPSG